jgi:hypothetical protein
MGDDDSTWYIRIRGKMLGPFTWPQLEAMRVRGQLSRFHELSQNRQEWIVAGNVVGLFVSEPEVPLKGGDDVGATYEFNSRFTPPASAGTLGGDPSWFYARDGAVKGPFGLHDVRELAARGEIQRATLVWREGMAGWIAAGDFPELAAILSMPTATSSASLPLAVEPYRVSGFAVASLVLGILWLCGLGSLLAVIFGSVSLSQISKSRGALGGKGMAIAGLVLGIISLAFLVLLWLNMIGGIGQQDSLRRPPAF